MRVACSDKMGQAASITRAEFDSIHSDQCPRDSEETPSRDRRRSLSPSESPSLPRSKKGCKHYVASVCNKILRSTIFGEYT